MKIHLVSLVLASLAMNACGEAPTVSITKAEQSALTLTTPVIETTPIPLSKLSVKIVDKETGKVAFEETFDVKNQQDSASFKIKYGSYKIDLKYIDSTGKVAYSSCAEEANVIHQISVPEYVSEVKICKNEGNNGSGDQVSKVVIKPVLKAGGTTTPPTTNPPTTTPPASTDETTKIARAVEAVSKIGLLIKDFNDSEAQNSFAKMKSQVEKYKVTKDSYEGLFLCGDFGILSVDIALAKVDLAKKKQVSDAYHAISDALIWSKGSVCEVGSKQPANEVWDF